MPRRVNQGGVDLCGGRPVDGGGPTEVFEGADQSGGGVPLMGAEAVAGASW